MGLRNFKRNKPEELWCHYCHWLIPLGEETIDHVTPLSKGGSSHDDNLVWSCLLCNVTKSSMDYPEFKWRIQIMTEKLFYLQTEARHKGNGSKEVSKFVSRWMKFHSKIIWIQWKKT